MSDDSPARRPLVSRWRQRPSPPEDIDAWDQSAAAEYNRGAYDAGGSGRSRSGRGQYEAGQYESGPYVRPTYRTQAYPSPVSPTAADRYPSDPPSLFDPGNQDRRPDDPGDFAGPGDYADSGRTAGPGSYAPGPYATDPGYDEDDVEGYRVARRQRGPVLVTLFVAVVVALVGVGGWWIATGPVGASGTSDPSRSAGSGTAGEGLDDAGPGGSATDGSSSGTGSDPQATGEGLGPDGGAATALTDQATISAESTSKDGQDAAGAAVSYQVQNVADGSATTTWRMNGDGTGRSLLFSFDQQVTVTEVAMTNGYTKRDRDSGADRYLEERRITRVTWATDDGTRFEQTLTDPDRTAQRMQIPVTTTSSLTLTIERTTEPGDPERDYTAISEVEISGAFT